jgi:ribosome maturation factor RimP
MSLKKRLSDLFEEYVKTTSYELVDLTYQKEGPNKVLRILIDNEKPITVDDCVIVSRAFGQILDDGDFLKENYSLEVSSPGIDRPLVKLKDFDRFKGNKIVIKLVSPIKEIDPKRFKYEGNLKGVDEDVVILELENEDIRIPYSTIKKSNIIYEF